MNKLAAHSINAFRTAQELSSSEPAQLRRTISDLEARIEEQDTLIAQQNEGLQNLARKLEDRERELQEIKKLGSKNEHGPDISTPPSGLLQSLEQEKLAESQRSMEALIEDFQEGFWTLFSEQRQGLEECLAALEQLPATAETRSLYARVKRQWKAIEAAKKRNTITPGKRPAPAGRPGERRCDIHFGPAKADPDHSGDLPGRGPPGGLRDGPQAEEPLHQ